jgi:sulfite dehydrogenase
VKRRDFLRVAGAAAMARPLAAGAAISQKMRVVVVGGGFGGATAAKYLRLWNPALEVVLVERTDVFTSCPLSNLVIAGFNDMDDIRASYAGLKRHGVQVVKDEVTGVDADRKVVRLERGGEIGYERLVLSPGVDFRIRELEGYAAAIESGRALHAWRAGAQTLALRKQLEGMPDGGVFAISIPLTPFRCPPGPYERASLVADYFKRAKPRSKVLLLDANPDVASKPGLFKAAWRELYPGIVEYRSNSQAIGIDGKTMTLKLEVEDVRADVLNIIPPQRAGHIAQQAGALTQSSHWCDVDWRTMESKSAPGVHVLGDATLAAPAMPKSGSMANNHAKIAAAAIIESLSGRPAMPMKILNTCYSFVSQKEAIRVSSVHEWDAARGTLAPVKGAGGISAARSEAEGRDAWSWARNIWADSLG